MKRVKLLLLFISSLVLIGCGSESSSTTPTDQDPPPETKTAYLIDSAVDGVEYISQPSGKSGTTSDGGKFEFVSTDTNVSFSIGGLKLPDFNLSNLNTDNKILPTDLVGVDRNNTNDANVTKLLQIFQSLDDDGNPDNGISITQNIRNLFGTTRKILDNNISMLTTLFTSKGKTMKSVADAKKHFEKTLRDSFSLDIDTVSPTIPTFQTDINITDSNITYITIKGEVGAKILVNGIDINLTIDTNGTKRIELNTTNGGDNSFSIILQDNKENNSTSLIKTIYKIQTLTWKTLIYNEVVSPHTGKIWLDRNLGASMVCTESRDSGSFVDDDAYVTSQQNCFGDYYQWGRESDGHEKSNSSATSTRASSITSVGNQFILNSPDPHDWLQNTTNDSTNIDDNGSLRQANWSKTDGTSICPVGFRVPTIEELRAETVDLSGFDNRDDAFNSFLKLPSSGYRDGGDGALYSQGNDGDLWSASESGSCASLVAFFSSDAAWYSNGSRATGSQVRCLRD
jgi:hypothetical protein